MYHSAALTGMRQLHEGGVAEYEMLQMEVDDLNGLRSGFLRIGAFSSVATHWLPLDAGDRVVGDEGAVAGQILHKELQFLQHPRCASSGSGVPGNRVSPPVPTSMGLHRLKIFAEFNACSRLWDLPATPFKKVIQ